ncbi:hypothetical protein [Planococcus sp. YIM B11945]|uniref:hypothetical protein n=1 Tax=Planococcus sp. YIM B11945 TaxID=3435410 RepID=UPI003D7D8E74
MDKMNILSFLEKLDELEALIKYSYKNPRALGDSLDNLKQLESLLSAYPFLETAVQMAIINNFMSTRETEFDKHAWFSKNYKHLLPESYELTYRSNDPKHIPDFWLKKSETFIPVEIKLKAFTASSLKQLQRYMDFYKCDEGIAVGEKVTCDLPENILFISFNNSEVEANELISN